MPIIPRPAELVGTASLLKAFMNSGTSDKAFTQNWLQSLTLVAREPAAQRIKPLLDCADTLSRMNSEADRSDAAARLWEYATAENLKPLLEIIPFQQPIWHLDPDETFVFHHQPLTAIDDLATWMTCLGVVPADIRLVAHVTSKDWMNVLRDSALRQQRAMNVSSMPTGMNLELPCTATWDLTQWSIRFDQADWVDVQYEEPYSAARPAIEKLEDQLSWLIATAHDKHIPKTVARWAQPAEFAAWMACVPSLELLHRQVLIRDVKHMHAWFRRTWSAVWPVMYRQANVLRGQAELDTIRRELAACVEHVPQLTVWLFVFAKLVCTCHLGTGLGISGLFNNQQAD